MGKKTIRSHVIGIDTITYRTGVACIYPDGVDAMAVETTAFLALPWDRWLECDRVVLAVTRYNNRYVAPKGLRATAKGHLDSVLRACEHRNVSCLTLGDDDGSDFVSPGRWQNDSFGPLRHTVASRLDLGSLSVRVAAMDGVVTTDHLAAQAYLVARWASSQWRVLQSLCSPRAIAKRSRVLKRPGSRDSSS